MKDECYHTKYEGCEPCEHDLKRAIAHLTAERDRLKALVDYWIERSDTTYRYWRRSAEDLDDAKITLHQLTAERDRYREALEDIADQGGTFSNGKCPTAYCKGHRARVALAIQMTYTDNLTH